MRREHGQSDVYPLAIYVFAEESSRHFNKGRLRAVKLARSLTGKRFTPYLFRDWYEVDQRDPKLPELFKRVEVPFAKRTGLRDLLVTLSQMPSDDASLGRICVVADYLDAFDEHDKRAVVDFFHSYKIRLFDAGVMEEVELVPRGPKYSSTRKALGQIRTAVTTALKGTNVGRPKSDGSPGHEVRLKAVRKLMRAPVARATKKAPRKTRGYRLSYSKGAGALNELGISPITGRSWTASKLKAFVERYLPQYGNRREQK